MQRVGKNVAQIQKRPLDEVIVEELRGLWEGVKDDGMGMLEY